jgi:hypothetical protein
MGLCERDRYLGQARIILRTDQGHRRWEIDTNVP